MSDQQIIDSNNIQAVCAAKQWPTLDTLRWRHTLGSFSGIFCVSGLDAWKSPRWNLHGQLRLLIRDSTQFLNNDVTDLSSQLLCFRSVSITKLHSHSRTQTNRRTMGQKQTRGLASQWQSFPWCNVPLFHLIHIISLVQEIRSFAELDQSGHCNVLEHGLLLLTFIKYIRSDVDLFVYHYGAGHIRLRSLSVLMSCRCP